jgi:glycosyltransferase involved in cell wall biosynthesis
LKILVISQYFWPENFRVNDLCLELKNRGYEVSVLTGKPNYPIGKLMSGYSYFNKKEEYYNGIKIYRSFLIPRGKGSGLRLFFNYLSFAIFASFRIFTLFEKFDKIIVYQLSPATVGFPGIIARWKFKAKLYFYVQDLWPESIVDAGGMSSKFIFNAVNSMMNLFYDKSTQIWVQSLGFRNYLEIKGVHKSKIKFLPNTVESFYRPEKVLVKYKSYFPLGFNIVFAGNIGVAQDFDSIILSAQELSKKNIFINWVIIGDGREKNKIIEKISKLNLEKQFYFLGSYPSSEMPFFFACADALLVSLKSSEIFSLTIPSKLQSYLACGKPLIGNVNGEAAFIINASNAGLCSSPGDFLQMAYNVELLYNKTIEERDQYGRNGIHYFQNNFDRNLVYDKLIEYLK